MTGDDPLRTSPAAAAIVALARQPLRHVVLLKHIAAFPESVRVHRVESAAGAATLVLLAADLAAWDRAAYPAAETIALLASDHPDLTAALLPAVPRDRRIVFKLAADADRAVVARAFELQRRTAFVSFTAAAGTGTAPPDGPVVLTTTPDAAAFALFEEQGHARAWLAPLLAAGRAFAVVAYADDAAPVAERAPVAACFAFACWEPVWEIGGVVTRPAQRRRGLAARVVGAALAELARRGRVPRYQVEEDNVASIAVARACGLAPFLTLVHHAHGC